MALLKRVKTLTFWSRPLQLVSRGFTPTSWEDIIGVVGVDLFFPCVTVNVKPQVATNHSTYCGNTNV